MAEPLRDFAIDATLGVPTTVIEASAGTGKTHAISGLTVRVLADGDARAGELLVVTFTRAATTELRERIRTRLVGSIETLAHGDAPDDDALIGYLRAPTDGRPDPAARLRNLQRARSEFDALTVATIHSFAQQAIAAFGVDAGIDPDTKLVAPDPGALDRACTDQLAIEMLRAADDPPRRALLTSKDFRQARVKDIAHALARNPDLRVNPEPSPDPGTANELMVQIARDAVARLTADRRRRSERVFDDLILDMRRAVTTLEGREAGDRLGRIRDRYRCVLIDEFQDTDPIQWYVFEALFASADAESKTRLVLVGDPKQAIYRFRGADLHAYTSAIATAASSTSLRRNWRSDRIALAATEKLFGGVTLGPGVEFVAVEPRPDAPIQALTFDGLAMPGLSIRVATNEPLDDDQHSRVTPIKQGKTGSNPRFIADDVRAAIAEDLVRQIGSLLDHGEIDGKRVGPGDIAVLVAKNREATELAARLREASIPAVIQGSDSVLLTRSADDWRLLLAAVANPSDTRRVKAAALSVFGAATDANELVEEDLDSDHATPDVSQHVDGFSLGDFRQQVARWSDILRRHGTARFVRAVLVDTNVAVRVFDHAGGERRLVDLQHIADLLQQSGLADADGLLGAIAPDRATTGDKTDGDDLRRIDSDRDAVTVMTMHKAKGLEFPIVCCTGLMSGEPTTGTKPVTYHDDRGIAVHDLQVTHGDLVDDGLERARREVIDDRLRIAYVALTRAVHHTIVWWAWTSATEYGPLTRLVLGRDDTGQPDATMHARVIDTKRLAPDAIIEPARRLDDLATTITLPTSAHVIDVGHHDATPCDYRWSGAHGDVDRPRPGDLAIASHRPPEHRATNRWSFSSITRTGAFGDTDPDDVVGGEDESPDFGPGDIGGAVGESPGRGPSPDRSALTGLTRGREFGTLVHTILEHVDFTSPTLADDLDQVIADELAWRARAIAWTDTAPPPGDAPPVGSPRALLRAGILSVIATSLGSITGGAALRDFGPRDRLNELDFDLRLPPATEPVSISELGRTLSSTMRADDPYLPWATSLAGGRLTLDIA
ncbi:MAG: UvrD-helicase domain-containing protein, partial [Actinobacteria bacterium]|nr:UvrD-helicase domain-containing protein [Actinomycetota bacterium]